MCATLERDPSGLYRLAVTVTAAKSVLMDETIKTEIGEEEVAGGILERPVDYLHNSPDVY